MLVFGKIEQRMCNKDLFPYVWRRRMGKRGRTV